MKTEIAIKKGYTIIVESWENDADNYGTSSITVQSKEYAQSILKMCKSLFNDSNNNKNCVGNMSESNFVVAHRIVLEYAFKNPLIVSKCTSDKEIIDSIMDINFDLLGDSEYYFSRVFDNGKILYSPEDIFLEVIEDI